MHGSMQATIIDNNSIEIIVSHIHQPTCAANRYSFATGINFLDYREFLQAIVT